MHLAGLQKKAMWAHRMDGMHTESTRIADDPRIRCRALRRTPQGLGLGSGLASPGGLRANEPGLVSPGCAPVGPVACREEEGIAQERAPLHIAALCWTGNCTARSARMCHAMPRLASGVACGRPSIRWLVADSLRPKLLRALMNGLALRGESAREARN